MIRQGINRLEALWFCFLSGFLLGAATVMVGWTHK
jgi:hypothetical protein